ncbi:MAG: hypothetical protein RRC07_00005, partial [Anaerolineae bacterium]|nr:hypothetical protein [Anaerolineae bacterium]
MAAPARRWFLVASILMLAILVFTFLFTHAQAETAAPAAPLAAEVPVGAVARDSCLHCHIGGENKSLWAPLARWTVFGTVGLVFAFGLLRSTSTWRTRAPWRPLHLRAADWADERYQLRPVLRPILDKPVPLQARRWFYCLG